MAQGKKYNAFSGVFTPSILTILGVIMYMRQPWVVGQAGLLGTIAIILLAHVISITTGLSISSIATDKKIKTGGIYYMLSRSLGLPMGGAIGIALFIGTALSISLYIVGFAESFLSVEAVQQFLGLSADLTGYRIVGTAVIILLVIIAFISTSFAMRIQFFIMITIALSLVSIWVGLFNHTMPAGATAVPLLPKGDIPLEYIFAIFFPAATGFTAGVAMSGDLKNPKASIPKGTILAIGIGFLVYLTLTFGLSSFVSQEELINNYNILVSVAFFSPLVIAGIWGATLSSALGGILGGPRILQAISRDKMMPKLFAKGYGKEQEPRSALLLIFAIAEGGILIGELDIIAGVVSMFYLASYGFINLSYVLEKWASTDFRPTFKIHISFGIIGFIASFAIMFKMDMLSMIASFIIMGALYFFLKRKEIKSESGDVWQSVWASIMRRTLAGMDKKELEERNWKPNIILFSGGTSKRPHLLDFGKALIGKYGLLSNFDLIENKNRKSLFTKQKQSVKAKENKERGIFTRQQSCRNIYEGIEVISETYGFSGVEPNTVLMGWGRETKDPVRFVQMLNTLNDLDLNILLLDYDKTNGFGDKKQIDIWWKDTGNQGNLSLTLVKFLSGSFDWNHAKIRLLIVNQENKKMEMIRQRAGRYLENMRIDAELLVINNEIEQKSLYELMKVESKQSDLIFLGIPPIEKGAEAEFVRSTNDLMHQLGSVVLVKASSLFKEIQIGLTDGSSIKNNWSKPAEHLEEEKVSSLTEADTISCVKAPIEQEQIRIYTHLKKHFDQSINVFYKQIESDHSQFIEQIEQHLVSTVKLMELRISKFDQSRRIQLINENASKTLMRITKAIGNYVEEYLKEQKALFSSQLSLLTQSLDGIQNTLPKTIEIDYDKQDLTILKEDTQAQIRFKKRQSSRLKTTVKYRVAYQSIMEKRFFSGMPDFLLEHFQKFGVSQARFSIELLKLAQNIEKYYSLLSEKSIQKTLQINEIKEHQEELMIGFKELHHLNQKIYQSNLDDINHYISDHFKDLNILFNKVHPNALITNHKKSLKQQTETKSTIAKIPSYWFRNQILFLNAHTTEIRLLSLKSRVKAVVYKLAQDCQEVIEKEVLQPFNSFKEQFSIEQESSKNEQYTDIIQLNNKLSLLFEESNKSLNKSFLSFPYKIEVLDHSQYNEFESLQFNNMETNTISAKQLIDYLLKDKMEAPLLRLFNEVSKHLNDSVSKLNDTKRLLEFSKIQYLNSNQEEQEHQKEIAVDTCQRMDKEYLMVENLVQDINSEITALFQDISQSLSYYSFIKTACNLKHYVSYHKKESRWSHLSLWFKKSLNRLNNYNASLIYTINKWSLFRKQYDKNIRLTPSESLLDLNYELTPSKSTLELLPFYYKQLFNSSQALYNDFWQGREKELEIARTAIARYKDGFKGVIAITGQTGVGKSFFSHYLSSLENAPRELFISPTNYTSLSSKDILNAFQTASNDSLNGIDTILTGLPKNSIVVIDELDIWFQHNTDDNPFYTLLDIMKKYSSQIIFIVNMHQYLLDKILKNKAYNDMFSSVVSLSPLDSKTLKDIVLSRHKTSGFNLKLPHTFFNRSIESRTAYFFNKIHKLSKGNIQAGLLLWLSSIQSFENNTIEVNVPKVHLEYLDLLNIDQQLILKQLLIYQHLTLEELAFIFKEQSADIYTRIHFLKKSGLLQYYSGYYSINPYLKQFISAFLQENGLLVK